LKPSHLVLLIPFLIYLAVAAILDPGTLVSFFPDRDLTTYLAAVSIGKDGDLAYTREDSDRYLKLYDQRPSPFRVVSKKVLDSSGKYEQKYTFYSPEIFTFIIAPFLLLFGFRGWLVFHALLILIIYLIGWVYYSGKDEDAVSPAINSVVFFTLIPVPILFLLPSHHLFLLAVSCAAIFFGIRGFPVICAILCAVLFSSQPFAAIFCLFFVAHWQLTRASANIRRFVIAAVLAFFVVWGLEMLMYPASNVSNPRWVTSGTHQPLAQIWNTLPDARTYFWTSPDVQRLADFAFGRNSGFLIYGFAAGALLLSTVLLLKDSLIRSIWMFAILYVAFLCFWHTSSWNTQSFVNDIWILLCPFAYFAAPLLRPKTLFITIAVPAAFLIGPLLINPLGAIIHRSYYSYTFPYRYLPVEVSLVGRAGITKDPLFRQSFQSCTVYFLNDRFYKEEPFFWLQGESSLEFLLQYNDAKQLFLELNNGVLENSIGLKIGDSEIPIQLNTAENRTIDLTPYLSNAKYFEGFYYLHCLMKTGSGYVPGVLSRDNPDYRFLSARVRLWTK
jgi:hypothetical protein